MTDQARCEAEITECKERLRDGNRDLDGLILALHDWRTERRMIELAAEAEASA